MAASRNRPVQPGAVALDRDLRLYGWVQFFPGLALPVLLLLFPPKYTGSIYWLIAIALYALAKLFELSTTPSIRGSC